MGMHVKRSPLVDTVVDAWWAFVEFMRSHTLQFSNVIFVVAPFACMFIGSYVVYSRGGAFEVGGELAIPFVLVTIGALLRGYANKVGKGTDCPVPQDRFTSEDEYGEVFVETSRLQEMILYVDDVENWLTRKGML